MDFNKMATEQIKVVVFFSPPGHLYMEYFKVFAGWGPRTQVNVRVVLSQKNVIFVDSVLQKPRENPKTFR